MQLVLDYHRKPVTTSVLIAKKFDKNHKDVLEAIRQLICSQEFRERNFTLSSYQTVQNKPAPMYIIGRDGFTMLVMSFTGAKAASFREEFIDQFNRMEEVLRLGSTPSLIPTYQNRISLGPPLPYPSQDPIHNRNLLRRLCDRFPGHSVSEPVEVHPVLRRTKMSPRVPLRELRTAVPANGSNNLF